MPLKQVKSFLRGRKGQNVKALALVVAEMDHVLEHRDWDGLATLISQSEAQLSRTVRAVVGECIGGITMTKDAKHHTGMKFKLGENFGPTETLDAMRDLVAEGNSIFGEKVKALLGDNDKAEAAAKTPDQVREHVKKFAAKHGLTIEVLTFAEVDPVEQFVPEH